MVFSEKLEGEKIHTGIYMFAIYTHIYIYKDILKETHTGTFRQSDRTDKWMDRHVVGLTEEKTDEQRDTKTKHKQGRRLFTIMLIYR